jgi:hypothetical protein
MEKTFGGLLKRKVFILNTFWVIRVGPVGELTSYPNQSMWKTT